MSNSDDGSGAGSSGHEGLLPPNQLLALRALLAGKTQGEAAKAAGVCRQTVNDWLDDPDFRAVYNRRRKAMQERADQWAWSRQDKIFDALDAGLERGDPWLALKLAEKMGMFTGERPEVGPTDPVEIRLRDVLAEFAKDSRVEAASVMMLVARMMQQKEKEEIVEALEERVHQNGGDDTENPKSDRPMYLEDDKEYDRELIKEMFGRLLDAATVEADEDDSEEAED